jgi:hypothetical protein
VCGTALIVRDDTVFKGFEFAEVKPGIGFIDFDHLDKAGEFGP